MARIAILFAGLLLLGGLGPQSLPAEARPVPRVIGGGVVAPADATWNAALVVRGRDALSSQFCGGTVVAPSAVVTAAHCVAETPAQAVDVVIGRKRLSTAQGERIAVRAIRVSPAYFDRTGRNDVAVLLLERPTAAPALSLGGAEGALVAAGATVMLYGWGKLDNEDGLSDSLRAGLMRVLSSSACMRIWGELYSRTGQLCAVGPTRGQPDACPGDSGSPIVAGAGPAVHLVGLVSFGGERCGDPAAPTVFTRVAFYARWIAARAGIAPPPGPEPPPVDLSRVVLGFSRISCTSTCRVDVSVRGRNAQELGAVEVRIRKGRLDRVVVARRVGDRGWRATVGKLPAGRVRVIATGLDLARRVAGRRAKVTVRVSQT